MSPTIDAGERPQLATRRVANAVRSPNSGPSIRRLPWLDGLRGLAVIGMIETHTCNTFLAAPFRSGPFWHWLNWLNGLVAPAFLAIAGFAAALSLSRRTGAVQWSQTDTRLFVRLGYVGLAGYLLHVPYETLFAAGSWRPFWQVDILPCLAVSLGALHLVGRTRQPFAPAVVAAIALVAVAIATLTASWRSGVLAIDAWVDPDFSLFPIFPWLAFAAAGWIAGWLMGTTPPRHPSSGTNIMLPEPAAPRTSPIPVPTTIAIGGFLALAAGWLLPGSEAFSRTAPAFFLQRLGALAIAGTLAGLVLNRWGTPRWLSFAGRRSLFVYLFHLVLIERLSAFSLPPSQSLGILTTVLTFLGVTAISLLAALAWEGLMDRLGSSGVLALPARRSLWRRLGRARRPADLPV